MKESYYKCQEVVKCNLQGDYTIEHIPESTAPRNIYSALQKKILSQNKNSKPFDEDIKNPKESFIRIKEHPRIT